MHTERDKAHAQHQKGFALFFSRRDATNVIRHIPTINMYAPAYRNANSFSHSANALSVLRIQVVRQFSEKFYPNLLPKLEQFKWQNRAPSPKT